MTGTPISVSGPGMRARSRRARLTPGRVLRWVIPVLLAIALVAWLVVRSLNASGAESDRYATATATRADVTETYQGSGTVQKTDQASIGFPSAGTVISVSVTLRQRVQAGQELARMDNTDLRIAVIQAKQALADAEVNLESAQNAADSVSTGAASSAPTASSSTSSSASRGTASTTGGSSSSSASRRSGTSSSAGSAAAKIRQLSRAVSVAQARLNGLNALVAHDFAVQQATCAPLIGGAAPPPVTPRTQSSPPAQSTPPAHRRTGTHPVAATTGPTEAPSVTATNWPDRSLFGDPESQSGRSPSGHRDHQPYRSPSDDCDHQSDRSPPDDLGNQSEAEGSHYGDAELNPDHDAHCDADTDQLGEPDAFPDGQSQPNTCTESDIERAVIATSIGGLRLGAGRDDARRA